MLGRVVIAVLFISLSLIDGISGLTVSGNKILDASGKAIILRGVVKPSFEWSAVGESASQADYALMKSAWNVNTVRIPLNQGYWLSIAPQYVSGYAKTIAQQVAWIRGLGMYVILDLHWSHAGVLSNTPAQQCMADQYSATFWGQVATAFKNDTGVVFELYNEPYLTDWGIWLSGGNTCGFAAFGMQQLYAAVRATGATNIVIAGGLNYAFDLSGVSSHALTGTNIAYATHPYDYSGKGSTSWDAAFGYLAATSPVVVTEFGQYCNTDTYVQDLLAYMQTKSLHWTAWAWYVNGCSFPSIISDYSGTPLGTVGQLVQTQLKAGSGATATATTSTSAKAATTTTSTTKAATTTTTSTTKAASTSTTGSTTGGSGSITMVINSGCNSWYFAINSFTGTLYTSQSGTQTVQIKDSSANAPWLTAAVQTWGWSFSPPTAFVLPISVRLTTAAGKVATMTNAVPTLAGATITVTTSYV